MTRRNLYEMLCAATVCIATSFGCGGKAAKARPNPAPVAPPPTAQAVPTAVEKAPVEASPHVAVSDDLATKCKLRFANVEQSPKFGFDDSDLLPADRDVLQQIAECLTRGALQTSTVRLIGRTDPRGTDEFNLGLGSRRANTVKTYLERLGVPETRMSPTTKGEVDATGSDEAGWQRDRRVDVTLMN